MAFPSRVSGAPSVSPPKPGGDALDVSRTVTEPEIRLSAADSFEGKALSVSSVSPFSSESLPRAQAWFNGTLGLHTIGDEYARPTREVQKALVKTGHLQVSDMPPDVNDWGAYFKNTFDAVAMFQADMGLNPPKRGYADTDTQGVLRAQAMAVDVAAARRWRG